ncbi:imidazolonepropionase [Pseudoalteromonas sp. A25]|uniref:amidohydrolase family protein n=1 Tax=Pseudoalteromonas sp. A25 TaxID=116092 RepID=UPI0012612A4B|nr:amidohydrolase family protein [Pseudoalteromonas sp. A25]BBN83687.1 imidazolonepropionase [Pseudoalteromonas sp. A25]
MNLTPNKLLWLIATLLLTTSLNGCHSHIAPPKSSDFIITNVNIVDPVKGVIHQQQSILVKNGNISLINNKLKDKASSLKVIDGHNGYITPGLIDMHTHFYDPSALMSNLAHGVTHVRILNGAPEHLKWRNQERSGLLLGASVTVSSPILTGTNNGPLAEYINDAKDARQSVIDAKNAGYDLIKAYGSLNEEALSSLINTAKELGIPVAKHGPNLSGNMSWQDLAGLQSLEHTEEILQSALGHQFNQEKLTSVLLQLKQLNVPITPTLNIFWQLTRISEDKEAFLNTLPKHYISPILAYAEEKDQIKRWVNASAKMARYNRKTLNQLIDITKQMHSHGIEILVGSDAGVLWSPHGLATHQEMALLAQAGLTNFEVLKAATYSPAKAMKLEHQTGQIKEGLSADFIYTKRNPIDDLSVLKHPDAISKRGIWLTQAQLTDLQAQAIENRSLASELWILLTKQF